MTLQSTIGGTAALFCATIVIAASNYAAAQDVTQKSEVVLEFNAADIPRRQIGEKYPDTAGADIVTDAPWRVLRKAGSWIPLMIFVPDARLPDKGGIFNRNPFRGFVFKRITVYADGREIYNDTDNALPTMGSGLAIVNENGEVVSPDIAGGLNNCGTSVSCDVPKPGGWHRILRLPVALFPGKDTLFLRTEIVAVPVYERPLSEEIEPLFFSRTLKIRIADSEFPSLGRGWAYYDVHMHTVAEWSLATDIAAPRKAFGGPIQMIKESAYALGLTQSSSSADFVNRVIATDHNAFFSDAHIIGVGPTSIRPGSFQHNVARFRSAEGQIEYENMQRIFGFTFGEEVTLQTDYRKEGLNAGSHLLMMRADHFDGPWHGGNLGISWLGKIIGVEPNPNSVESTLARAARHSGAFAYVAHPLATGNSWTPAKLDILHDRTRRFVTSAQKFVMKGAQYWNEKNAYVLPVEGGPSEARYTVVDFFDLHPFGEDQTKSPPPREPGFTLKSEYPRFKLDPTWDRELQLGLIDWHRRIRQSLRFSFVDKPDEIFPRKIYISGGSDAHGDFNYSTSLLATVLDKPLLRKFGTSQRAVTTNAFAKVRTYVYTEGKPSASPEERALDALADGNSVITDGPVIAFTFDADLRFDSRTLRWRDAVDEQPAGAVVFDDDGRIGGNGAFDGGWTALVIKNTKQAAIQYRWNNASDFGQPFGGAPRAVELYVDTPDSVEPELVSEIRKIADGDSTVSLLKPFATLKQGDADKDTLARLTMDRLTFETPAALSVSVKSTNIAGETFSAYTNPIWVIPVSINVEGGNTNMIEKGRLKFTFKFDMSMRPLPYEVGLLPLNEKGESDGRRIVLTPDQSFGTGGWAASQIAGNTATNTIYVVANDGVAIDPTLSRFKGKFAVYLKDPQDAHGNILNSIGTSIILGQR
jgi:hypothetical protein